MMLIDNKFDIGAIVYIKVDLDQNPLVLISVRISAGDGLLYLVSGMDEQRWMYDIELSLEPNVILKTSN